MPEIDKSTDTLKLWGFKTKNSLGRDVMVPVPKILMLLARMGPPPFTVTLPSGMKRTIVELEQDDPAFERFRAGTGENTHPQGNDQGDGAGAAGDQPDGPASERPRSGAEALHDAGIRTD